MNICKEKIVENYPLVEGNLYTDPNKDGVWIFNEFHQTFINLETGKSLTGVTNWSWKDVTDQYCLQRICETTARN